MPGMNETAPDDLRATIEAAVDAHKDDNPDEQPVVKDLTVDDGGDDTSTTSTTSTTSDTPAEGEAPTTDVPAQPTTPPGEAAAPADTTTPAPGDPDARAPGSWTPQAREKWGKLDPEIRKEVWKREREASRAMTISSDARKFANEFEKTVQPFMGFITAEKATPMQAFASLMQSGAILRVGTQQQKVALVADTIRRYGVDLGQLDSFLAGQKPANDPQQMVQQLVQQQLQPIQQQLSRFQQMEQQELQQVDSQIDAEIETFANDPKNEFWNDVQHLVPDIMELSARSGKVLSLTEAYQRAILFHEPVRQVIDARKQKQTLAQKAQQAAKARNAGSSVTSSASVASSVAQPAAGDSIRADIERAIAAQQGR